MKAIERALLALIFTLALFVSTTSTSMAAITATSGISLGEPVSLSAARYGTTNSKAVVEIQDLATLFFYLSYHATDSNSELFTLNSVTLDFSSPVFVNGVSVSREVFTYYDVGNRWNWVGYYGVNSYTDGPMNQAPILVGWGNLDSVPYEARIPYGNTLQVMTTYDTNQGIYTSSASIENIPESSTAALGAATILILCFWRRKH